MSEPKKPPAPAPVDPEALKKLLGAGVPGTPAAVRPVALQPKIIERGDYKSICSYGQLRTGKTKQIADLIQAFGRDHVAVIDCDRGLATLENLNPIAFELLSEDDFMTLPADELGKRYMENVEKAWEYIRTHLQDIWWVAMDNTTSYSDWVEDRGDVKMAQGVYRTTRGEDQFGMWRDTAREQLRTIRRFRHLPVNFYINSLEDREREKEIDPTTGKMKETGLAWAEPALAGRKAALRYPSSWDLVMRFTKEASTNPPGILFKADTQGDKTIVAGSRIPGDVKIPRYLEMGVLLPNGDHYFDPKVHWNIVSIWEKMVGMTAAEWIERRARRKEALTRGETLGNMIAGNLAQVAPTTKEEEKK